MQFPYWPVKIVKKRELAMCKEIRAGGKKIERGKYGKRCTLLLSLTRVIILGVVRSRAFLTGQTKTHSWHLFLSSKSLDSCRLIQEGVNPESVGYSIQLCDKENERQGLFRLVMKKERKRNQMTPKNVKGPYISRNFLIFILFAFSTSF